MGFRPRFPGDFPSLGYEVAEWMESVLAMPDRADYEPLRLYREQVEFLINFYRLDPVTGKRVYKRGLLGRPRGWGKSPFAAAMCAAEGLGPVLFDYWDDDGQPVGKPWAAVRTPKVLIAAVSETQTKFTFEPLVEMLNNGPAVDFYPSLEAFDSRVILPRGSIEMLASSARSVKGARSVFTVMDQTEEWVRSNGGLALAQVLRSNAGKVGGSVLETPNAFIPGEGSVAEEAAADIELMRAGKKKINDLWFDMREAPAETDMGDYDSLIRGLRYVYGCSSGHPDGCVLHGCAPGHVDLDNLVNTMWTGGQDVQRSRSDFLNQITHASDSWISRPDLMGASDDSVEVADGERIVLGFDGSRGRAKGKADATALVGMSVDSRHLFTIRVWEKKDSDPQDWSPNVAEVDAVVRETFEKYQVLGFYADPSGWTGQVAQWEADFGRRLRVKASRDAPISAWPRGKDSRVTEYVERLRQALIEREISWDGGSVLMRHMLNARRRSTRSGYLLYKAFPDSPDKIDAAYAAVMAYKAYIDVLSKGILRGGQRRSRGKVVLA